MSETKQIFDSANSQLAALAVGHDPRPGVSVSLFKSPRLRFDEAQVDLKKLGRDKNKKSAGDLQRALVLRTPSGRKTAHGVNGELGESSVARVEMSITRIAQELRLEV